MASYKILSCKQADDTLFTEVEYTNAAGKPIMTVVAHFQPETVEEVEQNILGRFLTEDIKLTATEVCAQVCATLVIGKDIAIL